MRKKILDSTKKSFQALRKIFTFNIATMLFGALFLYMLITVLLYITSSHVTSYQVTPGPLAKNPVCTALVLRDEEVITADSPGYVRYYAREGMKVRKNGNVYALGQSQAITADVTLNSQQLDNVRTKMADFANSFSGENFYDTYSFKYEMEGMIMQIAGVTTQSPAASIENNDKDDGVTVVEGSNSISFGNQVVHTAPEPGLVIYSSDGFETKTINDITEEDFDQKSYEKKELITKKQVKVGDEIYKLIKNDNWTLMVPLSDKLAASLADRSSIKVKFLKDGQSQTGNLSIVDVGNQKAAKIELKNGMVRYASDRYLKVELVINTQSGLKIPMSSIVTKDFYLVPASYIVKGGNNDEAGFMRSVKSDSQNATEFVSATIYRNTEAESQDTSDESEHYCYVDKATFKDGDILHKPDSTETYVIGEVDFLEGVYSMNKGYAVFRRIDIIDQNDEYCIVRTNTQYGLEQFDQIVLNGETVKEEEILTGK